MSRRRRPSPAPDTAQDVLSEEALAFVGELHERFEPHAPGAARGAAPSAATRFAAGENARLPRRDAREVREGDWQVAPPPADLQNRRVEITGPTDRKMMINALNSGASGFMADFEDSNSPTWANVVQGQVNLTDAIERTIEFTGPDGREYTLNDEIATLLVRPRGWHLLEKHIVVDGAPGRRLALRLRPATSSTTPSGCSTRGSGPVLLPAEDGDPPRGAAVERRLHVRRGGARPRRTARSRRRC